MPQNYPAILATQTILSSRQPLLDRDDAAASCFSGTSFPSAGLLVGMLCFRTDQSKLYQLLTLTPSAIWIEIMDLSTAHGVAPRAARLATARNVTLTGEVFSPPVPFDGTGDLTIPVSIANSGVDPGNYTKVGVNAQGRVISGGSLVNADLPATINGRTEVEATRLRATSASDVSLAGTGHGLQVGPDNGANLAMDINEVQARNNGAAAGLSINAAGGNVAVGNGTATINLDGASVLIQNTVGGTALATVAEAEAAASINKLMSPTRVKNQIDARLATGAEAQAGANTTALMTPLRVKNYVDAALGITGFYYSGNQAITSAGLLTLNHGLGVDPKIIQMWLICINAEAGYAAGDEVFVDFQTATTGTNRFNSVRFTGTQILVRYSDAAQVFTLANRTTGAAVAVTNGDWRLRIRAWG